MVGIALILTVAGLFFLFESNISDAPVEPPKPEYTEFTLEKQLLTSKERMSQILDGFQDGQYNGEVPLYEAIKIIENEIKIQKKLYDEYKKLPPQMQTNVKIAQEFSMIGKYWFASEESLLASMRKQIQE